MEEKKKGGRINKKQADALNSLFFIYKKTRGNCFVLSFLCARIESDTRARGP